MFPLESRAQVVSFGQHAPASPVDEHDVVSDGHDCLFNRNRGLGDRPESGLRYGWVSSSAFANEHAVEYKVEMVVSSARARILES